MFTMKKFSPLMISCLLILALSGLVGIYSIGQSMALSPVIIGSDVGLSVNPPDASVFNIAGIYPGKTELSQITIRNEGSRPFNLYITFASSGDPVLVDVLYVKISDYFRVYFNGLMSGNHTIDMGEIAVGETRLLDLAVTMAAEAGNETQNKSFNSSWVFHAVSPGSPPPGNIWIPGSPPAAPLIKEPPDGGLTDEIPGEQVVVISPEEVQVQPEEAPPTLEMPVVAEVPVAFKLETPPTGTIFSFRFLFLLLFMAAFWLLAGSAVLVLVSRGDDRDMPAVLQLSSFFRKGK